jgi:hypothetical protein
MKRHESLAPLSREHHNALILAQLLKRDAPAYKGLPATIIEKQAYAIKMFHETLKNHFRMEDMLLEKAQHCHEEIKKIGGEIIAEHQNLTESFLSLDKAANPADSMDHLGNALETHIRKEERILFPLLQKYCSDEILKDIGSLLH